MNKNKMHFLVGLISCTFMSTAIVLCLTNFKVSKLNACPPQDSKFLSLIERSLEQCVEECARRKSCEVVGYKRSFRLCELHADTQSPDVDDNRCVMIKKKDISGPPSKCTNCGEWCACDEETGHCSRQECPLLTTVANGTVLGNMNDFGAKKIVRCNTGYFEITGTHSVKCSAEGKWTRNDRDPHCQKCPGAEQRIQFPAEQFPWSQSYKLMFYTNKTTQQNARDICAKQEAHLVRIDRLWKLRYIRSILNTCFDKKMGTFKRNYWTDGEKDGDEIWKYSNGSNVPTDEKYWNQNSNGTGNCIRMRQRLLALSCNGNLSFICEIG